MILERRIAKGDQPPKGDQLAVAESVQALTAQLDFDCLDPVVDRRVSPSVHPERPDEPSLAILHDLDDNEPENRGVAHHCPVRFD